jgi:hypothetical protein
MAKNIIIYSDPCEDDEYSILIEDDGIDEYEDEGELSLADAESLAEEIQNKNPEYKIIYR